MINPESYTLEVARSVVDVENMRGLWEEMQGHPNAAIDFFLTILESRPEIVRPHVMLLVEHEGSRTMVVGRIEERRLEVKIGYVTVYRPKVRMLTVVHGGLMGNMSIDSAKHILSELLDALKREDADVLLLSNLSVDSHLYSMARSGPALLCRDTMSARDMHWKMTLPATFEEFSRNMSSNRRWKLRRYERALEDSYPGNVSFETVSTRDNIDRLIDDAEAVARTTYQRGLGVGFIGNEENRRRIALCASRGWLRAYILYVQGRPCAFIIGTLFKNTFHYDFTGYDPHYSKFEVGTMLFTKMVEDLCRMHVTAVDLGCGDAVYKRRNCDKGWEESSLYIFAPSFRGVRINIIRTVFMGVDRSLKLLCEKLDLAQRIKRIWRDRSTPATKPAKES